MRPSYSAIALFLLLGAGPLDAQNLVDQGRLQIHGFASQSAIWTSDNYYYGNSPKTSFDFTELGINASFQFSPQVLLSGQLLMRRAGEMYDGSPSVDYALADITLLSTMDRRAGVRVGRIKNPLGLYNETRDVPFTRPGIFLPQVVYYDKVRNLTLSSDGLMLYGENFGEKGNFSLTLGGGQAVIDENLEWTYLGNDFDGDLDPDGPTWIASLWYSTSTDRLKLGLSGARLSWSFDPGPSSPIGAGSQDVLYWIASFQYNEADWSISAEYSQIPTEWSEFGPYFPFQQQTTEGYYLQGTYHLRPNLELMARYEEGFADRDDRSGRRSSALSGGINPPFDYYTKIWTAGLRWDINPHLMLRIEYQRQEGTFALSWRENQDPSQLVKNWDVFAASISFRF